jgi:hypothetical protein
MCLMQSTELQKEAAEWRLPCGSFWTSLESRLQDLSVWEVAKSPDDPISKQEHKTCQKNHATSFQKLELDNTREFIWATPEAYQQKQCSARFREQLLCARVLVAPIWWWLENNSNFIGPRKRWMQESWWIEDSKISRWWAPTFMQL